MPPVLAPVSEISVIRLSGARRHGTGSPAFRPGWLLRVRIAPLSVSLSLAIGLLAATGAGRALADPTLAAPEVVAGPGAGIQSLNGMSIARDGTGGLVFTEQAGGGAHVFVSRLLNGSFQAPQEIDATLPGSSQPVIAAGNDGLLIVGFVNGGNLYTAVAPGSGGPVGPPTLLASQAVNPAVSINNFGKAYLAFAGIGPGGHDVRAAYYHAGGWTVEAPPLDANAADDAGAGTGRPAAATSGDGVAIVTWGEAGHIYSRRVVAVNPSTAVYQVDVPSFAGASEVSVANPTVASGGNSSYADIAFAETLSAGGAQQTRLLVRRLVAGSYEPAVGADGLRTPGTDSAQEGRVTEGEYGRGFVTSGDAQAHQFFALQLNGNGTIGPTLRVDTLSNTAAPHPLSAQAGLTSEILAWQETPAIGPAEIRFRYAADGSTLAPEQVASTPTMGPTNAAFGLAGGGDSAGDAALAWVQGSGSAATIDTAQLYRPPGSFSPRTEMRYSASSRPTFSWSTSRELWGPVTYGVTVNGVPVGSTTATSLQAPSALPDGQYTWQVTAVGPSGLSRVADAALVTVDTTPPLLRLAIGGHRVVGRTIHLSLTDTDRRPGQPAGAVSGVSSTTVTWGDGTAATFGRDEHHVYRRAGLYKLTVTAIDRAGNRTAVVRYVRIVRARHRAHRSRGHP